MAEGDEQAEQNERLLNVLGQLLMRRVRDAAIRDWDAILGGRMRSAWSRWVQKRLESLTEEQRAQVQDLVPDIVDTTLHHLLCTLEQADSVAVGVRASGAAVADIREAAAGDLHGYLSAWVSRFSAERHGEPHPGPTVALARFAVLGLPDVLARRVTDDVHRHLADLYGARDPQVDWDDASQRLLVRLGITEYARRVWGDRAFAEFVAEHVLDTAMGRPQPGMRVEVLDVAPVPEAGQP